MVLTDDHLSDEYLLHELDKIPFHHHWTGSVDDLDLTAIFCDHDSFAPPGAFRHPYSRPAPDASSLHNLPYTPSLPSFPFISRLSTPAPAASWQTARRALFTCRELVRTERHYLHAIHTLLTGNTITPPPSLMLHYVADLVDLSQRLLASMEENPSAWGVSAAFLSHKAHLEAAYVAWARVVGAWFDPARKLSKHQHRVEVVNTNLPSPLVRASWRRSLPSMPNFDVSIYPFRPAFEAAKPPVSRSATRSLLRDLAILPTQRITRYALLYTDLLAHTPSTAPSRALVERALEAARRVAQMCDRAQGNAAFTGPPIVAGAGKNEAAEMSVITHKVPASSSIQQDESKSPEDRHRLSSIGSESCLGIGLGGARSPVRFHRRATLKKQTCLRKSLDR